MPVISTVPQGSKLRHLLYILYANDIMQNFKFAKVKMYAENLTVYAVVNNVNDRIKLQTELNNLLEWSKKWQLNINFEKYHVIHCGKKIYVLITALVILLFILAFVKKFLVYYLTHICLSGSIYFSVRVKPVECAI